MIFDFDIWHLLDPISVKFKGQYYKTKFTVTWGNKSQVVTGMADRDTAKTNSIEKQTWIKTVIAIAAV